MNGLKEKHCKNDKIDNIVRKLILPICKAKQRENQATFSTFEPLDHFSFDF